MNNESPRIKLLVGISDFRIGGAQKVVADSVAHINAEAFEVHLVVLADQSREETFYEMIPSHVHIHRLHFSGFNDISSWRELYALLKKLAPDVVWSHLYFSNTVLRVLKPLLRYQVITVEHNTYVHKTFAQKVVDWLLAFCTYRIVAVSNYVADFTAKQEHISRRKFITIVNGVDVGWYGAEARSTDIIDLKTSLGFLSEDKVIISVGQLIKQKNHTLLIDAFAEFIKTHPEYKLIILGEGPQRGELESKIQKYGIADKVRLLGIQKNTPAYYAMSDFFVLPSLFEGFGLVCIEAMACGLPVLTTKVAGPDIYIAEGVDGFFFEPTVDDLVEKMLSMADLTTEQMAELRHGARNKACEYDIASAVLNYEQLFREAVK